MRNTGTSSGSLIAWDLLVFDDHAELLLKQLGMIEMAQA
ncbi:hypothetical protein CLV60_10347 [Dyadobacter jiangsuensis]|uniref:Uncharacterized protein n=1 Tax=Dyadobacter jiangsuensis TaxID=1591085 RepID=A0A2P8GB30_9BACT|nr:hypothetical protein CLV60_10347 [Dyadobacter jiangsuensis]